MVTLRCEIFPADLDATSAFYTEVLAFTLERDERSAGYLALRRDTVRLGARRNPPAPAELRRPPHGVELVLEVADLDAERDRVAATGWPLDADIARQPWGLRDFRLCDPDGYYWRITTEPGS